MTALHIAIVKQAPILVFDLLSFLEQKDEAAAATASTSGVDLTRTPPPPSGAPCPSRGYHPQHLSYSAGTPHMREALSSRTELGFTPLHVAAAFGNKRLVDALLHRGALETERDVDGKTPFHHPASSAAGDAICVEVDARDVVLGEAQARAIVRTLARGPAFRARSWCWPDAAAVDPSARRRLACGAARFRPVRAVQQGGGRKKI